MMPEPKYKAGDTVYHVNGSDGEHECRVMEVSTGYQGLTGFFPYAEPVYEITWLPTGRAVVSESRLTSEPTVGVYA